MELYQVIESAVKDCCEELYNIGNLDSSLIQLQKTRKEFDGDVTLIVFPLLKFCKKNPETLAQEIGQFLLKNVNIIKNFNVIKGFLNISISTTYWIDHLKHTSKEKNYGIIESTDNSELIMVEFSSPNTNKPLHLGHIRNNLIGYSICEILKAGGKKVYRTNLVNDRGIHICKSMLAWKKWGHTETPENSGIKGDHLVGKYYVKFDEEYKKEIKELIIKGYDEDYASKNAPIILEAQEMLRKWENHDPDTWHLWQTMNQWVYEGFNKTYLRLGVSFEKIYYESETYLKGKESVMEGLKSGIFYKKPDNSVWVDLTKYGLDEKLLLRSDGTSVYITQDIGTAVLRYNEIGFDSLIYVVGNEQDYHFKVLSLILELLGYKWAKNLYHLSYGMVELPEGKMKSREGTVVDADDLMDEMLATSRDMSKELGKLENLKEFEKEEIFNTISLGALKYFILKVDPRKNMTFDPKESVDFNGNTGPFIQYTYTRIRSVMRKAEELNIKPNSDKIQSNTNINTKEINLLKLIYDFPSVIREAGDQYSPATIANYCYEIAKEYNQYYHDYSILKAESDNLINFRLVLSGIIIDILKKSMNMLGIEMPERM